MGQKWKFITSQKNTISKKNQHDFLSFTSLNYGMFVTGTTNLPRLRRAVSDLWRSEKKGEQLMPPSKSLVKMVGFRRRVKTYVSWLITDINIYEKRTSIAGLLRRYKYLRKFYKYCTGNAEL